MRARHRVLTFSDWCNRVCNSDVRCGSYIDGAVGALACPSLDALALECFVHLLAVMKSLNLKRIFGFL